MKIYCTHISDTHTSHDSIKLPGGDILFHTGDMSYFGQPNEILPFIDWLNKQDYRYKILIGGNHDFGFENDMERDIWFRGRLIERNLKNYYIQHMDMSVYYLDHNTIELMGLKICGIPDNPPFYDWAFQSRYTKYSFKGIPKDLDVLMTHCPPLGILDQAQGRCGDEHLRRYVDYRKPKFHLFGHIHSGYGKKVLKHTTFLNSCIMNSEYKPVNQPQNFIL